MKIRISLILSIMFLLFCQASIAASSNAETPAGIPLVKVASFIDEYMADYIGATSPGAAVVLVKDGKIIFSKGYGYADVAREEPVNSSSTVFEYGSISKAFVYTTIMRLWEAGRLDLQTDVRDYLPDGFLGELRYDDPITMLDIMSHTAGFEDYLFDIVLPSPRGLPTLEQALKRNRPAQVYKPGTVSAYSNYAVALAAYICQRLIGQEFHTYLMETVFVPLAMNHTSAHPTLQDHPNLSQSKATGYYPLKHGGFKPAPWSFVPLYPVGAINGTAEDLARFAIALMPDAGQRSPLFEQEATLTQLLTQSHSMGPGLTGFSHGLIEWDGELRAMGHGGNTIAFSSQFNIVPEERFGVIVLTNAAMEMDICSGLTEALIGKRNKDISPATVDLPSEKDVEGIYISARRMHQGFLEFVGYLAPLRVTAMAPNQIQLRMSAETATLVQIAPYVYQRVDADGPIFKYHFGTVYFDVSDGKVQRVSGDFLPLPTKRATPWLITSLLMLIVSASYFSIIPLAFLLRRWRKRSSLTKYEKRNMLLVLCGTALLVNNAALVVRMLLNNYRSFSEVRIHILSNYPLMALAMIAGILTLLAWKQAKPSPGQKFFGLVTIGAMLVLTALLVDWQFLNLL
ncbi:MAG: beta-lactamase family protein [Limnochordia bacterium]|nr:beta-lactamase family protein [Limnochordia bacterium]